MTCVQQIRLKLLPSALNSGAVGLIVSGLELLPFVFFQVSEKLGLLHVSQGEGKERHLMVSKPGGSAAGVSEMEATDGAIGEAGVLEPKSHASSAGKVWSFDMFC